MWTILAIAGIVLALVVGIRVLDWIDRLNVALQAEEESQRLADEPERTICPAYPPPRLELRERNRRMGWLANRG